MTLHPSVISAAFLSTGLISVAPNVLLFLFPNYGAAGHDDDGHALLSLGQALAVGGLLGDVFLHTLPECFADALAPDPGAAHHEDHEGHHHHGAGGDIGLRVILGFAAFLLLDVFVRSMEERRGGGHSHSREGKEDTNANKGGAPPRPRILSSAVLLNLLGDALHNFTDGLAIGASFAAARPSPAAAASSLPWTTWSLVRSRGGLAAVAVFLHEIPHELGDFATLVRAGLTRDAAIRAQFLTAVAAFLGTAAGLFADRLVAGADPAALVPVTAGGFLYLAGVTLLPDVLAADAGARLRGAQVASFLLGVGFMYGVALLEEMEAAQGEHPHDGGHRHHGHHSSDGHEHAEL